MPLPLLVVLLESKHFSERVVQVREHFPDLEKIVVIVRSANGPTLPGDREGIELHRVNEFTPPRDRRIKFVFEPTNPVESIRQSTSWSRRYQNNIEFFVPTETGSLESVAQID